MTSLSVSKCVRHRISDIIHEGGEYFNDYFHHFHKIPENDWKYCMKNKKSECRPVVKKYKQYSLSLKNRCFSE